LGNGNKIAQDKLTEFFNNNADLKLVTGNSTSTSVAAGEVIAKKRLKGKVVNVGVGIPMIIEDHIINETMQEAFFWDPYLLGYSMGYIAFQTWLENTMEQGSFVASPDQQKIAGYESLELEKNSKGGSIIYGNAIVSVNKDNLKDWNDKFSEYGWIK
jgi:ABC-type sugar transport system substrate-binding protein